MSNVLKWSRLAAIIGIVVLAPIGSRADASTISFEGPAYTPGSIDLQDGWSSFGASGHGCASYDHAVVANGAAAPASFGAQSLRVSNAVTSGCFGDQTFSKSLANEAGETDAASNGYSGGARQKVFVAQWDFASTVPDAEQPGLSVVASPDRGDGARMSWIQMADTPEGLAVNFYDYQAGLTGIAEPACADEPLLGTNEEFVFSTIASGLDRTVPHTISVAMVLLDGPRNDVVIVSVDGIPRHVGTSWEDYFRDCEGTPGSRTVDSILFRTGGAAAPATAGKGFLIDNLSMHSLITDTQL